MVINDVYFYTKNRLQGSFCIGFDNDHTYPVDVNIQISALVVTKKYKDVAQQKEHVKARKVRLNKTRMNIESSKVRINTN